MGSMLICKGLTHRAILRSDEGRSLTPLRGPGVLLTHFHLGVCVCVTVLTLRTPKKKRWDSCRVHSREGAPAPQTKHAWECEAQNLSNICSKTGSLNCSTKNQLARWTLSAPLLIPQMVQMKPPLVFQDLWVCVLHTKKRRNTRTLEKHTDSFVGELGKGDTSHLFISLQLGRLGLAVGRFFFTTGGDIWVAQK